MSFIEALECLYKNRTSDEEFCNPFLLYCKMSDICNSNYEDKRKVLLFYNVNKRLDIVRFVLSRDETVESRYEEVADLLNESSFKKLIESVKSVVLPDYKREEKPKPQQKAVQKAVIIRQEEENEVEQRTPLTNSYASGSSDEVKVVLTVLCSIFFSLGILITIASIFCWPWIFWQWLIGLVGGLTLLVVSAGIVIGLEDSAIVGFNILGTIILGFFVLTNIILLLIFGLDYKIIYCCFALFATVGGAVLAFYTFDNLEDGWGIAQIVEIALAIVFFIIAIIWIR